MCAALAGARSEGASSSPLQHFCRLYSIERGVWLEKIALEMAKKVVVRVRARPHVAAAVNRPQPPRTTRGQRCSSPTTAQNPSVEAPLAIASTTMAAVTIFAPGIMCASVMPRGLAQAPQAQICPPLAT